MDKYLKYNAMQKRVYSAGTNDHLNHNKNKFYWTFFIKNNIKGEIALDFACGKGRNIENLLKPVSYTHLTLPTLSSV